MSGTKILIIGANGQIGSELAGELVARCGSEAVITSDLAPVGRVPGLAQLEEAAPWFHRRPCPLTKTKQSPSVGTRLSMLVQDDPLRWS